MGPFADPVAGPLEHLRVLDLSRVLAGPWSTQMLADMGADVLKVERPHVGDDTRHWGPPFSKQGDSAYYLCANRGKRSVEIDLSTSEGQQWVKNRVQRTDVLVENFKVGGMAKFGLDYASLKSLNPELIYCSITGFGQTGPYRHRPGYDFLIQAMGGLMSVTGPTDETPGVGPHRAGVAVADLMTGMYATVGILAALAHREKTGEGQYIDLALLDCQIAMLANQNHNYFESGIPPSRIGNAHPNIVPYQDFPTSDGRLIIAVGNDTQYSRFCRAIERNDLCEDERFVTNQDRVKNRTELVSELNPVIAAESTQYWIDLFGSVEVPCGPVNNLAQVFADPQVIHRQLRVEGKNPQGQPVQMVTNPIKFSKTPIEKTNPPPVLGQDNDNFQKED